MAPVVRFTLTALILHFGVAHATESDFLRRAKSLSCANYLTDAPSVHPGPEPTVPTAWQTALALAKIGPAAIAERRSAKAAHREHAEAAYAHEQAIAKLEQLRRRILIDVRSRLDNILGGDVTPALHPAIAVLTQRALQEVAAAKTQAQIEGVSAEAQTQARAIRAESDRLRREEADRLAGLERERRRREFRFDLNDPGHTPQILRLIEEIAAKVKVTLPATFATQLQSDLGLRASVIDEIQLARRLNKVAGGSSSPEVRRRADRTLEIRLGNTFRTLERSEHDLAKLAQLRRALKRLNDPAVYRGLVPAEGLKSRDLLDQEQIVTDALAREELETTILQASLELVDPPPAPTPPKEPSRTPPTPPVKVPKVKTRAEYDRVLATHERYTRERAAWDKEWADYKRRYTQLVESTHPAFVARVGQLRAAHLRRLKAREAFVAYLSQRRPQTFAQPAVAQRLIDRFEARVSQTAQRGGTPPIAARGVRTSNAPPATSAAASDDSMLWWIIYYQTMYPHYVNNPHAAYGAYQYDAQTATVDHPPTASWPAPDVPTIDLNDPTLTLAPPDFDASGLDGSIGSPDFNSTFDPQLIPDAPNLPGAPDLPSMPVVPAMSDFPAMPDLPSMPDLPPPPPPPELPSLPAYDPPTYTAPDTNWGGGGGDTTTYTGD